MIGQRLKRKLMSGSVDDALKDYTPPVKLTHGTEYITYETGVKKTMSGLTNEQWQLIFKGVAERRRKPSKTAILPFSISVRKRGRHRNDDLRTRRENQ